MTKHTFDFSIDSAARAEALALGAAHPSTLKAKVNHLLILANATMTVVLILLFCILVLCALAIDRGGKFATLCALFVGAPALAAFAYVFHSIFFARDDEDEEFLLTPSNAPAFFRDMESMRRKLALPSVDAVYLIADLNAFMQLQQIGIGWRKDRSIIGIGLPLLMALSKAETLSVIAHEFGHYAAQDGVISGRIYRARTRWCVTAWRMAQSQNILLRPLLLFLNWFLPKLDAWSFPLARHQEFAADRFAANATTSTDAAAALYRINLGSYFYCRHLQPGIWNDSEFPTEFTNQRLHAMVEQLREPPVPPQHELEMLLERTEPYDTHPSLRDRLKQLGQALPMIIRPLKQSALEEWFGTKSADLIDQFTRFHFGEFNRDRGISNLRARPDLKLTNPDAKSEDSNAAAMAKTTDVTRPSPERHHAFESNNHSAAVTLAVAESYWDKLYRARHQIHSDPVSAQAQLIACAEQDIFIAPHALRSLAELHAMKKEFEQEKSTQELVRHAQARVEHWYEVASEIDITEMPLRSSTLAPLMRSKLIVALRKFGAESALVVATSVPGYAQYEHLLFVLEFNGDFDAASDAICTVRVDGFTHQVFDYDELDEDFLGKICRMQKSKLY